MYLSFVGIGSFRNFKDRTFSLSEDFNLIIGENNSGKTNLLEAAGTALSEMLGKAGASAGGGSDLPENDRRIYLSLEWDEDVSFEWAVGATGPKPAPTDEDDDEENEDDTVDPIATFEDALRAGKPLPVAAYYASRCDVPAEPSRGRGTRLDGYVDALDARRNRHLIFTKVAEMLGGQGSEREQILHALEQALSACAYATDPVKLSALGGRACISVDRGKPRELAEESGGALRLASIAADLAYRCCVLNPMFGSEAPRKTSGIVLIDYLEEQLHPRVQRSVVEDLRAAFPQMQFIATSQSPFIIQSVASGTILDLDGHDTSEAADLSIEDIAEGIMGVRIPQRSKRYLDMNAAAKEAAKLIRSADSASEEKRAQIRARLDQLSMPFSTNQAFHAFIEMERLEAGLESEHE